ncbi:hypothetical protein [Thalassobacillus sp. C254]|uniref:hypothetical protein n=1 Tax=Thalassobacillus sp. C254 TaxID=1225341 RepID=UPI0006D1DE5C|nr:hypothetical protein [Thalassobacillus sp. C254]
MSELYDQQASSILKFISDKDISIQIFFISKNKSNNENFYTAYSTNIEPNLLTDELLPMISNYLKKKFNGKSFETFSPEASSPEEIYTLKK